jgi:hypothetical protein
MRKSNKSSQRKLLNIFHLIVAKREKNISKLILTQQQQQAVCNSRTHASASSTASAPCSGKSIILLS